MTKRIPILLLLLLIVSFVACKPDIEGVARAYLTIQTSLIAAHDSGAIDNATWAKISKIRNERGKPAYDAMLDAWVLYAHSKKPEDLNNAVEQMKLLESVIADLKKFGGRS